MDVLRGHPPAVEYVLALEAVPACSEVTRAEVLRGLGARTGAQGATLPATSVVSD
jgi:hypothetical protein